MNRQKRRLWRCAVLWMTVWLLLCGTVHAAGGTLTLRYAFDGVAFSIYRVAEPTAAGYALTVCAIHSSSRCRAFWRPRAVCGAFGRRGRSAK